MTFSRKKEVSSAKIFIPQLTLKAQWAGCPLQFTSHCKMIARPNLVVLREHSWRRGRASETFQRNMKLIRAKLPLTFHTKLWPPWADSRGHISIYLKLTAYNNNNCWRRIRGAISQLLRFQKETTSQSWFCAFESHKAMFILLRHKRPHSMEGAVCRRMERKRNKMMNSDLWWRERGERNISAAICL